MLLLGLDIGTTGCKAMIFTATGEPLARAFREYGVVGGEPGQAEQDAEAVWRLALDSLRELVATEPRAAAVRALSLSVQGDAIIAVDAAGSAVHPAILGMDYRSATQAAACAERFGGFALFQRTGMRAHPMNSLSKVLWLRERRPDLFTGRHRIRTYADFVLAKLGSEPVIDYTMASRTMAFDIARRAWSEELLEPLELAAASFSPAVPSGRVVGKLSVAVAAATGLPAGLMLVSGAHDQCCAAVGAGAIRPGLGIVSSGTAEVLSTTLPGPVLSQLMFESFLPCYLHAAPERHFTFALNHVGGILRRWHRDLFAGTEVAAAAAEGRDPYDLIDERMPDGHSPVMVLPHFNGSGTPSCDLASKGAIVGLTLNTTRHDIAKAIIEALCFEMNLNLRTMEEAGIRVDALAAVGGGARSVRWLQLKADILGRPVRTLRCSDAACLGAALLAGVGAGVYASLDEAVDAAVRPDRDYSPDAVRHAAYRERYSLYAQLHPSLRPLHERL